MQYLPWYLDVRATARNYVRRAPVRGSADAFFQFCPLKVPVLLRGTLGMYEYVVRIYVQIVSYAHAQVVMIYGMIHVKQGVSYTALSYTIFGVKTNTRRCFSYASCENRA